MRNLNHSTRFLSSPHFNYKGFHSLLVRPITENIHSLSLCSRSFLVVKINRHFYLCNTSQTELPTLPIGRPHSAIDRLVLFLQVHAFSRTFTQHPANDRWWICKCPLSRENRDRSAMTRWTIGDEPASMFSWAQIWDNLHIYSLGKWKVFLSWKL